MKWKIILIAFSDKFTGPWYYHLLVFSPLWWFPYAYFYTSLHSHVSDVTLRVSFYCFFYFSIMVNIYFENLKNKDASQVYLSPSYEGRLGRCSWKAWCACSSCPPIPQAEHRPEMSVFLLCVTYERILRQWNCLLSKASVQPPAIGTTCDSQTKLCILPIGATLLLCLSEKNSN